MDNFTKGTLICMIEDLTNNINILKQNNIQLLVLEEENTKLKGEIDDLNSRINQLKSYNKKYKEKHEELITKLESSKKEIEKLKDKENRLISEREELSESWEHKFIEQQEENQKLKGELNILKSQKVTLDSNNMSEQEQRNMLKFLKENYFWTNEPKSEYSFEGDEYKVAPSSTKDIHKAMVKWAKEKGIPNIGKQRGIPTEETFKKYIVQKHKKLYPDKWEISEVNEYPKYYNGSKKTPRVNLKIK